MPCPALHLHSSRSPPVLLLHPAISANHVIHAIGLRTLRLQVVRRRVQGSICGGVVCGARRPRQRGNAGEEQPLAHRRCMQPLRVDRVQAQRLQSQFELEKASFKTRPGFCQMLSCGGSHAARLPERTSLINPLHVD